MQHCTPIVCGHHCFWFAGHGKLQQRRVKRIETHPGEQEDINNCESTLSNCIMVLRANQHQRVLGHVPIMTPDIPCSSQDVNHFWKQGVILCSQFASNLFLANSRAKGGLTALVFFLRFFMLLKWCCLISIFNELTMGFTKLSVVLIYPVAVTLWPHLVQCSFWNCKMFVTKVRKGQLRLRSLLLVHKHCFILTTMLRKSRIWLRPFQFVGGDS